MSTPRDNLIDAVQSLALHQPFLTATVTERLLKSFLNKARSSIAAGRRPSQGRVRVQSRASDAAALAAGPPDVIR
jgi:hypothetical protein